MSKGFVGLGYLFYFCLCFLGHDSDTIIAMDTKLMYTLYVGSLTQGNHFDYIKQPPFRVFLDNFVSRSYHSFIVSLSTVYMHFM